MRSAAMAAHGLAIRIGPANRREDRIDRRFAERSLNSDAIASRRYRDPRAGLQHAAGSFPERKRRAVIHPLAHRQGHEAVF